MVVFNEGNKKIFITVEYEADENGFPAVRINEMYIGPGQGIELDILNLKPRIKGENNDTRKKRR